MYKGELFNYRYDEILAAIEATPGVSNMELARAFCLSYSIIRALTAAMEKEGDITGRVERLGLYGKTLWHVNPHKESLQKSEGRMSARTRAAIESPATYPVRVHLMEETPAATHTVRVRVVEQEAQPATHTVRVRVVEQEAQPATHTVRVRVVEQEAQPATYPVRVHVVEQEAQPATYPVRVHVTEEAIPATRRVPFPEVEDYLPVKHGTKHSEVR
jgi:hypothetical protein